MPETTYIAMYCPCVWRILKEVPRTLVTLLPVCTSKGCSLFRATSKKASPCSLTSLISPLNFSGYSSLEFSFSHIQLPFESFICFSHLALQQLLVAWTEIQKNKPGCPIQLMYVYFFGRYPSFFEGLYLFDIYLYIFYYSLSLCSGH